MRDLESTLTAIVGDSDPEAKQAELAQWLRRLSHDLASPIASFRLELQSLRHLTNAQDLARAGAAGMDDYMVEVLDIVENLEGALESARALCEETRVVASTLAQDGGS